MGKCCRAGEGDALIRSPPEPGQVLPGREGEAPIRSPPDLGHEHVQPRGQRSQASSDAHAHGSNIPNSVGIFVNPLNLGQEEVTPCRGDVIPSELHGLPTQSLDGGFDSNQQDDNGILAGANIGYRTDP